MHVDHFLLYHLIIVYNWDCNYVNNFLKYYKKKPPNGAALCYGSHGKCNTNKAQLKINRTNNYCDD
ncbi:hypothetical protein IM043_gp197 [Bacillus phage SPG24]|uniref:hypothetical protein n=1 Tax=Bacillus phage SPG24 TaxID=1497851 RepID=UPI0022BA1415|nr:hypothetical protein IM043_gp197 [Bacillus phage SPG24]